LDGELAAAKNEFARADATAKQADAVAKQATKNREAIEKNHDTALTAPTSTASGAGAFANPIQTVTRDQKTTEAIATTIKEIVNAVAGKNYLLDGCFAIVSRSQPEKMSDEERELYEEQVRNCSVMMKAAMAPK
jgi:hypothetical protein